MNAALARRWAPPALADSPALAMTPPDAASLQAIIDAAREEGFSAGYREGLAGGQADIRRTTAQIEGILDSFTRPLAELDGEVTEALATLAVRIAGSLLGREYAADPALLAELAAHAIELAGNDGRKVELRLHPDDLNAIAAHFTAPSGVRLIPDAQIARGDLRVHAESVRIDGGLEARLKSALEQIMENRA